MENLSKPSKPKYLLLDPIKSDEDISVYVTLIKQEAKRSNCLTLNKTKKFMNKDKQNPYHIHSSYRIIQALYDAGFPLFTSKDMNGKTCLHFKKDYKSLALLVPLSVKRDILKKLDNFGNTVLHQEYDCDSLDLLIKNGANPLTLNNDGEICTSYQTDPSSVTFLINYIANYIEQKHREYIAVSEANRNNNPTVYLKLRNKKYRGKFSDEVYQFNAQCCLYEKECFSEYLRIYKMKLYVTIEKEETNEEGHMEVHRETSIALTTI